MSVVASAVDGRPLVMRNRSVGLGGAEPRRIRIVTVQSLLCRGCSWGRKQQREERMRAERHHERFQHLRSELKVERELPIGQRLSMPKTRDGRIAPAQASPRAKRLVCRARANAARGITRMAAP